MSFTSTQSTDHGRTAKRRIQRRHGACEPCRSSKTKCDGRMPCGACRSERRRQCPCIYSEKVMKLQQVTADMRRRAEQERISQEHFTYHPSPSQTNNDQVSGAISADTRKQQPSSSKTIEAHQDHNTLTEKDEHSDTDIAPTFTPLSLCGAVDEFKALKPTRGSASHVVSRCNGLEAIDVSTSAPVTDLGVSRATELRPEIPRLITSVEEISFLRDRLDAVWIAVTQGRLKRAWVDLASLVREAEMFETSDTLNQISSEERNTWKQLWTNVLDLESQLGLTLGRPTSLVLPKQEVSKLETNAPSLKDADLDVTRLNLYQHVQSILSLDSRSATFSSDFHDKARVTLSHEPFYKVGLCTTDGHSTSARDLQLNTHLFFMVIYCRLANMCDIHAREGKAPVFLGTETTDTTRPSSLNQPRQKLTYCRMMFKSAKFVVSVFLSLLSDHPDVSGQNWMRCHSVFVAATLLGIAKLRHEVEWDSTTDLLRKLEHAFSNFSNASPNCNLFKTAINRLRDLNSVKEPASEVTRNKHSGIKHRKRHATNPIETISPVHNIHDRLGSNDVESHEVSPSQSLKRRKMECEASPQPTKDIMMSFYSAVAEPEGVSPLSPGNSPIEGSIPRVGYYTDDSMMFSESSSFMSNATSTSATSFCESESGLSAMSDVTVAHPGPPFAYPFPYEIVHPPMMLYNPTMLPGDPFFVQTPMGLQYFQAQDLDGVFNGTAAGVTAAHTFHAPHGQTQLAEAIRTPKPTQVLSPNPTLKSEADPRPGMTRRHSAETVHLDPSTVQTPVLDQWEGQRSDAANNMFYDRSRRATSVDDIDRAPVQAHNVQQQTALPQATSFFVPMPRPPSVPAGNLSQPMYQHSVSNGGEMRGTSYYGAPMTSTAELAHVTQDYTLSCHRQQEYIQGQEQWRQMSVNAGVPGGP